MFSFSILLYILTPCSLANSGRDILSLQQTQCNHHNTGCISINVLLDYHNQTLDKLANYDKLKSWIYDLDKIDNITNDDASSLNTGINVYRSKSQIIFSIYTLIRIQCKTQKDYHILNGEVLLYMFTST